MRRTAAVIAVGALTVGFALADAGAAFARGPQGPPTPNPAQGTVTCAVKASLSFNPPLQASATGTSTVTLHAQLVKCSTTTAMHRTTGHINVGVGTIASNTCTAPSPPSLSGIGVKWTPPKKVEGSTITGSDPGTVNALSSGQAQVVYTNVALSGSFASSTGTLTLNTRDTAANLAAACAGSGLDAITFGGVATGL